MKKKNRFIFGFANNQLFLYISSVEKLDKKKCYPHGLHFRNFPSYKAL